MNAGVPPREGLTGQFRMGHDAVMATLRRLTTSKLVRSGIKDNAEIVGGA